MNSLVPSSGSTRKKRRGSASAGRPHFLRDDWNVRREVLERVEDDGLGVVIRRGHGDSSSFSVTSGPS